MKYILEWGLIFSVREKPKTGPAAKIGPAKIWLGQFSPNFGWANFFHIMAGPKFGWANYGWGKFLAGPIMAGPNFWLGQFFLLFGWAKVWLLAQFWLGHFLAGPILLDRYYGWAILAGPFWLGLWLGHRFQERKRICFSMQHKLPYSVRLDMPTPTRAKQPNRAGMPGNRVYR